MATVLGIVGICDQPVLAVKRGGRHRDITIVIGCCVLGRQLLLQPVFKGGSLSRAHAAYREAKTQALDCLHLL